MRRKCAGTALPNGGGSALEITRSSHGSGSLHHGHHALLQAGITQQRTAPYMQLCLCFKSFYTHLENPTFTSKGYVYLIMTTCCYDCPL
ncbi:hypothetical protein STEG23_037658 [Scotinomys teguina]